MNGLIGFWSYVHDDDIAEGGRITSLAEDISKQYGLLTGENVNIMFVDKEILKWGDNWRKNIDENIASVVFFIAVITPRFIKSPECRRELQLFVEKATLIGLKELVLPLLYVNFSEFKNQETTDEIIKLLNTFQWEDWTKNRLLDVTSEGYRTGISKLVERLVDANTRFEQQSPIIIETEEFDNNFIVEEEPGFIDIIAKAEEALPRLIEIIGDITKQTQFIGDFMKKATEDVTRSNNMGSGFSARIIISKRLSSELINPVDTISSNVNEYITQLYSYDDGFQLILNQSVNQIEHDPETKQNLCNFFKSIIGFDAASSEAFNGVQKYIDSIESIENLSRDLRPILRRLKQALNIWVESRIVSGNWVRQIEVLNFDCDDI